MVCVWPLRRSCIPSTLQLCHIPESPQTTNRFSWRCWRSLTGWVSPPAGLDQSAAVTGALAGGTDREQDAPLLARIQYRSGRTDFQSLLESERTLLSSQDSLASARVARAAAAVQLYKALGGGWQAAPEPSSVAAP